MDKIKERIKAIGGKIARQSKAVWGWITHQYKAHTVRSVVVSVVAVALITTGILWLCGVFRPAAKWSPLPNRAYILAPAEIPEPQTLNELLHSYTPDIEVFLRNPSIAQELLDVRRWSDIVDSRLALYNLRELDRQLEERLTEDRDYTGFAEHIRPEDALLAQLTSATPLAFTVGEYSVVQLASFSATQYMSVFEIEENQMVLVSSLKATTARLLRPNYVDDEDLQQAPPAINLKGIWQSPGEVLIHLTPEADWLPKNGYTIARVVNGQPETIVTSAAAEEDGLNGNIMRGVMREVVEEDGSTSMKPFNDFIEQAYSLAELTLEKKNLLGVQSEAEFRAIAYRVPSLGPLNPSDLVSGRDSFMAMRYDPITIPADVMQKMPESDRQRSSPIQVMGQQPNGMYTQSAIASRLQATNSFVPSMQVSGIDRFLAPGVVQ